MRKLLVTRFHLAILGLLLAITVTAFVKIPVGTDLPVHWGLDGRPNEVWPRDPALLIFPVIAVLLTALFAAIGQFAPEGRIEPGRHVSETILSGLLGLLCALQFALILIGVGSDIDMVRIVAFAVAALLVVLGIALPQSRPNAYVGIRLPWTMTKPKNWIATHRLTGILLILGGLCLGLVAWFLPDPATMLETLAATLFLPLIIGGVFSFVHSRV